MGGRAVNGAHHEAVGIARHGLGLLLLRAGARNLATERLHRRLERRQGARLSVVFVCWTRQRLVDYLYFSATVILDPAS